MINYAVWDLSVYDVLLLAAACGGAGTAVGWLFYDSPAMGLAGAFLLFFFTKPRYVRWCIHRRQHILLLQFRDVLYSVASGVSAGRSLGQALEESVSFWAGTYSQKDLMMAELETMTRRMKEAGEQDVEVLRDFAGRSGLPEVADFVMVCENCRQSGADLVKAIDRAAAVIGDRIALEKELAALMAQKQFEGRIIMAAPFLLMAFLKISSPGFLDPLTASFQGYMVSSLALGLILAAVVMMERVNRLAF